MVVHTAVAAWQRVTQCGWKGSFSASFPPDDMVDSKSVVVIKHFASGVVIGYQVDEFTCTWLVGCFTACSHLPGFTGMVGTLTHFPL